MTSYQQKRNYFICVLYRLYFLGFPGGSDIKESACNVYFILFPCVSVCIFDLMIYYDVFLTSLFVSYLCSRFRFYGYHEVCTFVLSRSIMLTL